MRIKKEKSAREMIYEAAMDLFLEQSFVGTTIDQIVERSGYKSRSSVYAHCRGKDEIFENLVFVVLHDFLDCVKELKASTLSPAEKISAMIHHFVAVKCELPKQTELAIDQWRFLGREKKEDFVSKRHTLVRFIQETLTEGKEQGDFEFESLQIATRLVLHSIRWVDDKAAINRSAKNTMEVTKNVTDTVFKALRIPPMALVQQARKV